MTPNGAVLFAALTVAATMVAATPFGVALLFGLCVVFGVAEIPDRMRQALLRSLTIMAPLAIFMAAVWVGLVGRSPGEIAAGAAGTRMAALAHVATVCMRLFLVVLIIQLVVLRFAQSSPLQFIRALSAPSAAKKLMVLTLSWIDTILHAVDRARIALIAASLITPRLSLRNAANGWVLVQTAWLSAITIATGRLRDKWPAEDTPARLDALLDAPVPPLNRSDGCWIAASVVVLVVAAVA
jgi:hypothetical protein